MGYNNTYNSNYGFGNYGYSSGNYYAQQQKPVYEMQVKKLTICINKVTTNSAYMAVYDSENETSWNVIKGQQEKIVLEAILETINNIDKYGKHVLLYVPDAMTSLFSGVAVDYTINKRRSSGELVPDDVAELYDKVLDAWHSNYRNISLMRYDDQTKEYSARCKDWAKKLFDDVECGRVESKVGGGIQPKIDSDTEIRIKISKLVEKKIDYIDNPEGLAIINDSIKQLEALLKSDSDNQEQEAQV